MIPQKLKQKLVSITVSVCNLSHDISHDISFTVVFLERCELLPTDHFASPRVPPCFPVSVPPKPQWPEREEQRGGRGVGVAHSRAGQREGCVSVRVCVCV